MDEQGKPTAVVITDIDVPIGSLMVLMVKLIVAAIPVIVVVGIIWAIIAAFLKGRL